MIKRGLIYSICIITSIFFFSVLSYANILVISPHPDDDILMAAGITYRALQNGEPISVVYITNGDLYGGTEKGFQRQLEAVNAQTRHIQMDANNLIFLGYPDGYLSQIYFNYTGQNDRFTTPSGQSETYGRYGLGGSDYHSYRFGTKAAYNRYNILLDIYDIINNNRPEHIFTLSEIDTHSDHSTTYYLIKMAISLIRDIDATYVPTLHKTIIHSAYSTWPNPGDSTAYFSEIPGLSQTGLSWALRESIDVPISMQTSNPLLNPKYRALAEHVSQGGASGFLERFIHKDEFFWVENPAGNNRPPIVNAGNDQEIPEGALVQLDGSGSLDPDGNALIYQWRQTGGTAVQLANASTATPSFYTPTAFLPDEVLSFELTVSDGQFISVPDSVNITIRETVPIYAEIITFNDVGLNIYDHGYQNSIYQPGYLYPAPDGNTLYLPGYSDGILNTKGFEFSGQHFHTIDRPDLHGPYGGAPDNGSFYLNSEFGSPITMTSIDGRPFSLISFDGAECFVNAEAAMQNGMLTATAINVTGRRLDGNLLSLSFALDGRNDGSGQNPDFQKFPLPLEWVNLTSVTFSGLNTESIPGGFSLDNIVFTREPTTVTISNKQLLVNGTYFNIRGVVYSPVPTGVDPETVEPHGDYFTSAYSSLYNRDLPLLRQMGANTVRLERWNGGADHYDFLDKAYNDGVDPIYVIAGYWINAGLDIDPSSSTNVRSQIKADFRSMVATHMDHPAILMWSIGSDLNAPEMYGSNPENLFSLINEMAAEAHAEEGVYYHPVTASMFDNNLLNTIAAYEFLVPSLNVWGASVYRGSSFGTLFNEFRAITNKPLVILEYGIDAFNSARGGEYEAAGVPLQAEYAASLWSEIASNSDVCIGGTIMEYSDQWWKGALSTDNNCLDNNPGYHGICGYPISSHPDGYSNEEWWGIMRTVPNGPNPDIVEPRAAYYRLQSLWMLTIASLKINDDALYTSSTQVTLTLSCTDNSGCAQMQFSNDNVTWSTPVAYAPTRIWALTLGDGTKTVYAQVKGSAGGWSGAFSGTIILDTTAPVTTATPAGGTYGGSQTVTLTCSDGTGSGCVRTYYTTDGATPTTSSSVYANPIVIASAMTLKYFSVDRAGKTEAVKTQNYSVDTNPPTGTITINSGAAYSRTSEVTLNLSCSDNVGCYQMQFSNDNVTWSTPQAYAANRVWLVSAGDGQKTVYAKYSDQAGNWSTAYSDTIILDLINPLTTAAPGGGTYSSNQTVTLTCSDGTGSGCERTYYTTNGATPTTASSVYASPIVIASAMMLKYFSVDRAGNAEAVKTQNYTIYADTEPPTGTITINSGATYSRTPGVTLTLSCSDNNGCYQMQFSNDSATWSTPQAYAATRTWVLTTGDGQKTVYARYNDRAGNWSTAYSDTIILDLTNPLTTTSPGAGTYSGSQSVVLSCSDGSGSGCERTYYTTDGTTPTTASSVYASPIVIASSTTLKYFSVDRAGNAEGPRSQTYTITPDTTAPVTTAMPAGGTYGGSQTVSLVCSDGAGSGCFRTYYTTDGTTPTTTSSVYASPIVIASATTLKYFSVDRAGNAEAVKTQNYTIVPDTVAPVTTATPAGGTYGGSQTVTLSCSDGSGSGCERTYYTTDGTTPTTASSVYASPIVIASATTLKYFSVDRSANVEAVKTQNYTIVPDTVAPVTTASPGGGTYISSRTVTLTCSDGAGSGCERTYYTTDGTTPTTASSVYASPIVIASATTLKYFSVDRSANVEAVKTQNYAFGADTEPPTGGITINGGAAYSRTPAVTLTLSCSDNNGCYQMQFSNDSATWSTPQAYAASRVWVMSAGNGQKTVYARYSDQAGNWSTAYSATIILDLTNPLTTASPGPGTYSAGQLVTLICSDGSGSGCDRTYYTVDGTTPTTGSNVYTGPIVIATTTTLRYFSMDRAGNQEGTRSQTYTIAP